MVMHPEEKEFPFHFLHLFCVTDIDVFVVVSQEMEKTVDHQKFNFIHKIYPTGCRVPGSRFDGKDDISENLRMDVAKRAFGHRKRDHVGGAIPMKIIPVKLSDLHIIDKKKADFTLADTEFLQKSLQASPHPADIHGKQFLPIPD